MTGDDDNPVTRWFGARFDELHPLLRQLHRQGGVLSGEVELSFGAGLAGTLGRRLARRMGLPLDAGRHRLRVDISHNDSALIWSRRFDDDRPMVSTFEPIGQWPQGFWREHTGPLDMRLTVDVIDGAWHWRALQARLGGIRLPLALLPDSRAFKRVEDGRYRFEVRFVLPLLGEALSYQGLLDAQPRAAG